MPPDMPAAKLRRFCRSRHAPAGHILAGVIADPLDYRAHAAVAHAERSPAKPRMYASPLVAP